MPTTNIEKGPYDILCESAARGIAFQFVIACVLGIALLHHQLPFLDFFVWFILIIATNGFRFFLLHYFRNNQIHKKRPLLTLFCLTLTMFIIGIIWGSAFFYLFKQTHGMREGLIILTLGGMCLGGIPSLAPYITVYLAFVIPMITPIVITYFLKFSTDYSLFSTMVLAFLLMLIITAMHFKSLVLRTIALDKKKRELVDKLSHSNDQLKLAYQKIKKISRTDPLTELPNRRFFDETLKIEWARASREKKELSLILIDVDNFKVINDEYGHPEGDKYLLDLAKIMREQTRRPGDFLARIGGDEFAVILSNTPVPKAISVAENLRNAIAEYNQKTFPNKNLSISLGLSGNSQETSISALITATDRCLYHAKNHGKNQLFSEYK